MTPPPFFPCKDVSAAFDPTLEGCTHDIVFFWQSPLAFAMGDFPLYA